MRKLFPAGMLLGWLLFTLPAAAQLDCTVLVNSPEDQLMLAYNGADGPQDQVTALDKYAGAHADSKFMPCVNNYYSTAYMKLNNFDKAIEYGEKDIAANVFDINLMINLLKSYVGAGKADDPAFTVINKMPGQIKTELSQAARPQKMSDADWAKMQQEQADVYKDDRAYAEYAFFQLLPRVTDPKARIQKLDGFMQSFPDTTNAGQVNYQYFVAYEYAGDPAKADEYGEKAIAADPNNVEYLDAVANDYATRQTNLDKAKEYSRKVLDLAPATKKPDGVTDEQFKTSQNNLLGLAHLTLGYAEYQEAAKTKRFAPAIQEFRTATDLLDANPELQAKALYFLGYAYEAEYPANHKGAIEALTRAASLPSSLKGPSEELLAKVKKAAHVK